MKLFARLFEEKKETTDDSFINWFLLPERIERNRIRLKETINLQYSFDKYWIHYGAYWVAAVYFFNQAVISCTRFGITIAVFSFFLGLYTMYLFYKFVRFRPVRMDYLSKDLDEVYENTQLNTSETDEVVSRAVLRFYYKDLNSKLEEALSRVEIKMKILGKVVKICSISLFLYLITLLDGNYLKIIKIMIPEDVQDSLPPADKTSPIEVTPPSRDRIMPMGRGDSDVRGISDSAKHRGSERPPSPNTGNKEK